MFIIMDEYTIDSAYKDHIWIWLLNLYNRFGFNYITINETKLFVLDISRFHFTLVYHNVLQCHLVANPYKRFHCILQIQ